MTHDKDVWGVAFSPDGSLFASCAEDESVRVWDRVSGREIHRMRHPHAIRVAFDRDGRTLVSSGLVTRVWAIPDRRALYELKSTCEAAISPSGGTMAVAEGEHVRLVRVRDGVEVASRRQRAMINALAFSPDGRRLAIADREREVCIWSLPTIH